MKRFTEKWVLVTGAGSGIGRATAQAFAREGAHLLLVDVDDEGNAETQRLIAEVGGLARTFHTDVGDAQAMTELAGTVHTEIPAVDVLVNNAGIGAAGDFTEITLATWQRLLDINLMGVVHGCHYFLPAMVERGQGGHVVNLASAAAFLAMPQMSAYATSKFAVLGFTESLRAEMAGQGIGVSAICPGIVDTPIVANTVYEGSMGADDSVRERIVEFYHNRNYTPEQVAQSIIKAVRVNKAVRPVSPESWAIYYSKRLLPGLVNRLTRRGLPLSE